MTARLTVWQYNSAHKQFASTVASRAPSGVAELGESKATAGGCEVTLKMTSAQEYWTQEGCRLLTDDNKPPTLEERVKAAFVAGFAEGIEHSLSFETPNTVAVKQTTNTNE